ncbi:hypothetical protein GE061_007267 [Apolygus lucorum]|uniref:Peptidase S1 domain-containing protein n=1 Tax=Apolygus lucorum TaxID=248454 RepID=A0A6A4JEI7_APOLU|nr:hypothetical protein GE061_007267 [Apolygus lucorum]
MSLQLILALILASQVTGAQLEVRRSKRIIGGNLLPRDRDLTYVNPAIRYIVWISFGTVNLKSDFWSEVWAEPIYMKSAGVLLSPDVVLTSCTCVADFWLSQVWSPDGDRAQTLFSLINRFEIFFGDTETRQLLDFVWAKNYIIYERCRRFWFTSKPDDPEGISTPHILHDYGVILLERKVTDFAEWKPISYVPVSTYNDLIRFYYYAVKSELVCLFFGYGRWKETTDFGVSAGGYAAPGLSYGWRTLASYHACYYMTYYGPNELVADPLHFNYSTDAEWACANSVRMVSDPSQYSTSDADKGGPVTCNNELFGLISESFWSWQLHELPNGSKHRHRIKITLVAPLVHTLYTVALEYRPEFLDEIHKKFDEEKNPRPNPIHFDTIFRPTYILPYAASTSLKIDPSIYFILISMLPTTF